MFRVYLELMMDEYGNVLRTQVINREKVRERKFGTIAAQRRVLDDCDNVVKLRQVLSLIGGGPVTLAAMLGVSRAAIYQWIYRNKMSDKYAAKLDEIILEKGLTLVSE